MRIRKLYKARIVLEDEMVIVRLLVEQRLILYLEVQILLLFQDETKMHKDEEEFRYTEQ